MDKIIYILCTLLVLILLISSIGFSVKTKFGMSDWWYLQLEDTTNLYNPSKPMLSVVKVLQAMFINQDINMYDEETSNPAEARTSNLNEELGQVDTIPSDKMGTLTCNQMDFLKCSISGVVFGMGSSEAEIVARMGIG
ncbi:PREDICTED: probable phospholipid-transporting ATPase 4 [Nelumbo nucifera]|uniref:Probable phospholipid-transporting ATPase 4 n=1 Tax=Nelumbo nucifera TaxID=4432 RepID=A0A1U8Q331_NELNU|nr:PREDICTED: probable phospholipid-transporting ATPase 4 [Nelumbo nucifera]